MGEEPQCLDLHHSIKDMLMHRFDRCVINNVYRADYIECLVALTLGPAWWITWARGWDWAPWDCQHPSGARLEVKQAAARQSWDREACARRRAPRFDIAPRTGYWTEDESRWISCPGRPADIYVFAWHGERRDGYADHRDANQWLFFVVAEQDLPNNRKRIGLAGLESVVSPCGVDDLKQAVEGALPAPGELKAMLERGSPDKYPSGDCEDV